MQALQAALSTASATGTVPTKAGSSASNHPPLDTLVPVLVAGDYSTRVGLYTEICNSRGVCD